jgi:hypothetical protein
MMSAATSHLMPFFVLVSVRCRTVLLQWAAIENVVFASCVSCWRRTLTCSHVALLSRNHYCIESIVCSACVVHSPCIYHTSHISNINLVDIHNVFNTFMIFKKTRARMHVWCMWSQFMPYIVMQTACVIAWEINLRNAIICELSF